MLLLESCNEWELCYSDVASGRLAFITFIICCKLLFARKSSFLPRAFSLGPLCLRTTKCCTVSIFQFLLMIINYTNKHWNTKDSCWPRTVSNMRMISWLRPRCKICSEWFVFSERRSLFTKHPPTSPCIIYPAIHRRIGHQRVLIFKILFL